MSNDQKIYKETLSCRLSPRLRKEVQNEASEKGLTTSNYIESILKNRGLILTQEEKRSLFSEKNHLEAEVQSLEDELETELLNVKHLSTELESEREALNTKLSETEQRLKKIRKTSVTFNTLQVEIFNEYIRSLRNYYPDVNLEDLIIASIKASHKNETSRLFIHLIRGQLNQ